MKQTRGWQTWAWSLVLFATLWLSIQHDRQHSAWADRLSHQGGAAPAIDAHSHTGYVRGQRQFLGTHERGETYRWIARTQDLFAPGARASGTYRADNVPVGRPELAPKLYTFWLAAISWVDHAITGDPIGLAVERVAVWEPVVSHVLAFLAVVVFMWARFGPAAAAGAGLFFAFFPLASGQFLPGVLTPRTWALLLATYALSLHVCASGANRRASFGIGAALAAALALWLDPAVGFCSVVISGIVGVAAILRRDAPIPFLRWAMIGSAVAAAAWFIDNPLWSPAAGELRYVHPLYAIAWLGFGLALDGWQRLRQAALVRRRPLLEIISALPLLAALTYTQIKFDYKGWLYPSAAMERLTSLDETVVFRGFLDWLARATPGERLLLTVPLIAAVLVLAWAFWRNWGLQRSAWLTRSIVVAGIVVLACREIRWLAVVALVAVPLIAGTFAVVTTTARRWAVAVIALFLVGLMAWDQALPPALQRPSGATEPTAADINALVYRHFAHWLASHNPGQKINALAPPELSDSLVFHGGSRVLMSTAWQSYPGQVAASRFLSAPEPTEAEAVLQSREITHVILPSWDEVLPLLVHEPAEKDKTTLYSRLQRWIFPPYLRPIPYHLPPVPGYVDQKLAVFKVVPAQDEALSLARLAEYFVEMDRPEPATLVTKVLVESYPDDPNAVIARAIVSAHTHNQAEFDRTLAKLASDAAAGKFPSSWDRRVQRAIVLALGGRDELARKEVEACVASTSRDGLFDLTPLQAFRLRTLADHFNIRFQDEKLGQLLAALSAEFSPPRPSR